MTRSFLVYTVLASSLFFTASAEWHVENVAYAGQTPAISLDSSGLPRIAYGRPGQGAKFAEYNGTSWSLELIYDTYYGDCEYFDIVTDENDVSHVSFAWSGWIISAFQDPVLDSWSVEWPLTSHGEWNSIGLSSQNYPGICFYSYVKNLQFEFWDGSQWTTQIVDAGTDAGNYNSMLREGANEAFVAYSMTQPTTGLKYANRDESGVWHTSFVDTSMTSEPMGISLANNGNGYPCISYTTPGELRYAEWDGSAWNVETVLSLATGDAKETGANAYDTSLAFTQYDHPRIAHCNLSGDSLSYSWNDGTGWQTESIFPVGDWGGDLDLVLDSQGRPHIAFFAGQSEGLMYAFNDEVLGVEHSNEAGGVVTLNAVTNPFYGSLNMSFSLPEASYVTLTVFDLQGRTVDNALSEYRSEGNNLFNWTPDAALPLGEYIIVLDALDSTISQRVIFLR
ncbi:MAG: T9SS type A sorting domain-containing protein [Candidatus Sabulitectum sp.]|nr:T9SS type A sorting domain-containing protein [Candidatus Sabulitectum sp.]